MRGVGEATTRGQASSDPSTPAASPSPRRGQRGSFLCASNYCLRYPPPAPRPQMIDTGMTPTIGFRCRQATAEAAARSRCRRSTPSPIATNVMPALMKWSRPASRSEPTNSATPIRPTAPGTSSQNAGRNVASAGGPGAARRDPAATGVHQQPAEEAAERVGRERAPTCWPIQAANSTTSSQPSEPGGPEKCTNAPRPKTTTPSHGAQSPNEFCASLVIARSAGIAGDLRAGDDPEAEQDELHDPRDEPAGAADHLVGGEVERGGRQQAARQEGDQRRDQHAHRAVDRPVGARTRTRAR